MGLLDFLKKDNQKDNQNQKKPVSQQKPAAQPQAKPQQSQPVSKPASAPVSNASTGSAAKYEMYTVKEGDWLSKIAGKYYGDVHKWDRIYQANRDQISDPDVIRPGQIIKIPLD